MTGPRNYHVCHLGARDTTGLPKLPPNASCWQKLCRNVRKLFLLNPRHFKCKQMYRNKSAVLAERRKHATSRYSLVIHPFSTLNIIIAVLFVLTWAYSLMYETIMIFSENKIINSKMDMAQCLVIDPIRLALIVSMFNIGYIQKSSKKVVFERKKCVMKYLKTYFFFDIMSVAYLKQLLNYLSEEGYMKCSYRHAEDSYCCETFNLIRVFCCGVRIGTMLTFMDDTLANMRINHIVNILIQYAVKTYLYLHILTFITYYVPMVQHRGKWPPDSWVSQAMHGEVKFHKISHYYSESFLMVVCNFFGISTMHDVTRVDEQICAIVVALFGRIYTLYLLADILNIFGVIGISESMYEKQLSQLKRYMVSKDLPQNLRQRMLMYYEFKYQGHFFKEKEIVSLLSEHLRAEIFLFAARMLVQKVDFFKKIPNSTIGAIIAAMRAETYSPKDVIVSIGVNLEEIFFVSNGTVAVYNYEGIELCHLRDGEVFGLGCFFMDRQMYTIVAVETTEVFAIPKDQFMEFLAPHPEVMNLFNTSVKARLVQLKHLEHSIVSGKKDLMSELSGGRILERRTRRLFAK